MDTPESINQLCAVGVAAPSGVLHHSLVLCSFMLIVPGSILVPAGMDGISQAVIIRLFLSPKSQSDHSLHFITELNMLKSLLLHSPNEMSNKYTQLRSVKQPCQNQCKASKTTGQITFLTPIPSFPFNSKLKRITQDCTMLLEYFIFSWLPHCLKGCTGTETWLALQVRGMRALNLRPGSAWNKAISFAHRACIFNENICSGGPLVEPRLA